MSPEGRGKGWPRPGAYGILISNHGGNIVENSLAPCDVIEDIRKEVGDSLKVFADGGVRSGEDVFKMLALGADAVGIGRPVCAVGLRRRQVRRVYLHPEDLLGIGQHHALTIAITLKDITRVKCCSTENDFRTRIGVSLIWKNLIELNWWVRLASH